MEITDIRVKVRIAFPRLVELDEGRGRPISREEAKALGKLFECESANFMPISFAGCCDLPDEVDEDEILGSAP